MIVGVRFEGDSPVVVESRWLLGLAAGCGSCRGTTLAMTAQFVTASFASSPRLWRCNVLLGALFACVCVVMVFASACYVRILLVFI